MSKLLHLFSFTQTGWQVGRKYLFFYLFANVFFSNQIYITLGTQGDCKNEY